MIGTDGGLLESPVHKSYVMLAPGERLDVWADFSGRNVGSQLVLRSSSFSGVLPKMAERMMGHASRMHQMGLPIGSDYPLLTVKVTRQVSDSPALPNSLSSYHHYQISDTANPNKPVPIAISEGPMSMLLNGRPYAYNDALPSERILINTIQLMEIFHAHGGGGGHGDDKSKDQEQGMQPGHDKPQAEGHKMGGMGMMGGGGMGGMMGGMHHGNSENAEGDGHKMGGMGMMGGEGMAAGMGAMMSMAHPIHLHGQSFQILSRSIGVAESDDYATVKDGFIEGGFKDTVLVMPGERVKIIKPFQDFKGLFMYHCHNLEHEDMGMMREFSVE